MLIANAVVSVLIAHGSVAAEGGPSYAAATNLSKELEQSSSVSIYFVTRTEDYSYGVDKIKAESSFWIVRKCGGNCSGVMAPIIQHLRVAVPAECEKSRQDVLIEVDGRPILIYAQGGRAVQYKGMCYFNPVGVKSKIKESEVIPIY